MLQHPLRAREQQLPKRSTIPEYLLIFAPVVAPLAAGWRLQKNDFLKSTFKFVFCFCSKIRRNDDDLMHKKNTKSIFNIIKMLRYITTYCIPTFGEDWPRCRRGHVSERRPARPL